MAGPTFTISDLMDILVIKAGLPPDAATDDHEATLADVDLDSLALIQLVGEVEERFGVDLGEPRPELTFGELLACINQGISEPSL